jgi:hypothetical protein
VLGLLRRTQQESNRLTGAGSDAFRLLAGELAFAVEHGGTEGPGAVLPFIDKHHQ